MANLNYKEKRQKSVSHAYYNDMLWHQCCQTTNIMYCYTHKGVLNGHNQIFHSFSVLLEDFASCRVVKEGAARFASQTSPTAVQREYL